MPQKIVILQTPVGIFDPGSIALCDAIPENPQFLIQS